MCAWEAKLKIGVSSMCSAVLSMMPKGVLVSCSVSAVCRLSSSTTYCWYSVHTSRNPSLLYNPGMPAFSYVVWRARAGRLCKLRHCMVFLASNRDESVMGEETALLQTPRAALKAFCVLCLFVETGWRSAIPRDHQHRKSCYWLAGTAVR